MRRVFKKYTAIFARVEDVRMIGFYHFVVELKFQENCNSKKIIFRSGNYLNIQKNNIICWYFFHNDLETNINNHFFKIENGFLFQQKPALHLTALHLTKRPSFNLIFKNPHSSIFAKHYKDDLYASNNVFIDIWENVDDLIIGDWAKEFKKKYHDIEIILERIAKIRRNDI